MPEHHSINKEALCIIYGHYKKWANAFEFACDKGCSTCCTQSVTMTTLEGELIADYIQKEKPELLPLLESLPPDSTAPTTTTNQFAQACLEGKDLNEEEVSWNFSPCLFLRKNCCTIYPVRSFMCRSFGSKIKCNISGSAEVDPVFLTLNTVIMQCIEHLDQGRPWGNLNSILRLLTTTDPDEMNKKNTLFAQQIPGFLIPPEEHSQLQEHLNTLLNILQTATNNKKP